MNLKDILKSAGCDLTKLISAEVGAGWVPIVKQLISDLFDLEWDGQVIQVKEKFGELRFYVHKENSRITTRIQQAGEESRLTCESCGTQQNVTTAPLPPTRLWIRTLCTTCRKSL